MDLFARLPPELIREIIRYAADFAGIESLLATSPHVKAVFQAEPRGIMQDLLALNPITIIPEIHQLFRGVAFIQSNSIYCSSLDEYIHLTGEDSSEDLLNQLMDNAELSHCMIHIASQIQQLACLCLLTMQKNFVSAVGTSFTTSFSPAIRMQKASEPFSWIEEYRMYWSLWHLRHFSDLRKAVQPAEAKWSWRVKSIERLDAYVVWNDDIYEHTAETIWGVATVLVDLGLHRSIIYSDQYKLEKENSFVPPWTYPPQYGVATVALGSLKRPKTRSEEQERETLAAWDMFLETPIPFFPLLELPRHDGGSPVWATPPIPEKNPVTSFWSLSPVYCHDCSSQTMLFRAMSWWLLRSRPAVKGMLDMQPYRRMGALLWDTWRMFSVGLYPNCHRERTPTPDGGFIDPEPAETREGFREMQPKWLALIGKSL